jgi:plastocyanin
LKRFVARAAVAVVLAGCSSGSGVKDNGSASTQGSADAQTVTVSMGDSLRFSPNVLAAKVGTVTIRVNNTGQVPHNLVFDDSALGKTPTVDGKELATLKVSFDKAGTFRFTCTFHSGMTGKVVVS